MNRINSYKDMSLTLDNNACLVLQDTNTDEVIWQLCAGTTFAIPSATIASDASVDLNSQETIRMETSNWLRLPSDKFLSINDQQGSHQISCRMGEKIQLRHYFIKLPRFEESN